MQCYGVLAFETTPHVDLMVQTWSRKVHQVQARFGPFPNPEPDFGSSLAPMLNFGPDQGPVHQGSGLDQSSEPNCSNTSRERSESVSESVGIQEQRYYYYLYSHCIQAAAKYRLQVVYIQCGNNNNKCGQGYIWFKTK